MSRVLVRKADIVYDVMTGRPQLQVGVGTRRDRDGRRMMPTFGGEGNLVAVQDALTDRAGRIANIESQIPVDPRTGFRSAQDEKEFQHAMGQLGSGFASDQERIAFGARHEDEGAKFDAARRGAGIGGRVGQGLGALGTSLVGVMSGLSALESGQGPLAAGLTGYTAAQQLGGMTPYLTEAGMRAGAGLGARIAPRHDSTAQLVGVLDNPNMFNLPEDTSSTAAVAEPTMNNVNTTGSVNPNLITSYGGASAGGQSPVGVVSAEGAEESERMRTERRAPQTAQPTQTTLPGVGVEAAASAMQELNQTAAPKSGPPSNAGGPDRAPPMTAADPKAAPVQSSTSPQAAEAAKQMKLIFGGSS